MSTDVFLLRQGDTSPALLYDLIGFQGTIAGSSVAFYMEKADGTDVISGSAGSIEDVSTPTLRYDFSSDDSADAGQYKAYFKVTYADGTIGSWPNRGFIPVLISRTI